MAVSDSQSQGNIQSLLNQGYNQEQLSQFDYGGKLNSNEMARFQAQFKPGPTVGQQVQTGISDLASQQYQFDPNQYLPGIQGQAESIYSPQQAQLEAIRQLQQASYQDSKVQNEKDFQKVLKQETEAINSRGGFFSSGAIQNENDLQSQFQSQQFQQGLQFSAAQYGNYAQQALLAAEKTQFIQDKLYNAENSAYARWTDQRNFSLSALQSQYQVYSAERDFARNVFESDRTFSLQEKQFDMQQKAFKQQYKMDDANFKMAKEQFNVDMKIKNLSYESALSNFKKNHAVNNSGVFGVDADGNDIEQSIFNSWGGFTSTQGASSINQGVNFGF